MRYEIEYKVMTLLEKSMEIAQKAAECMEVYLYKNRGCVYSRRLIETLDLPFRLECILKKHHLYYIGDVLSLATSDLVKIPKLTGKDITQLKKKLKALGIQIWDY